MPVCYNIQTMENLLDEKLVKLYLGGDDAAFETLIKRYSTPIYSFARQYVGDVGKATDITQETFVKCWRNLKKFDADRSFKTWIFAIAKNTAIDWLKKKEEIPFSVFENDERGENILEEVPSLLPSPHAVAETNEGAEKIDQVLHSLPEHYGKVVLLRHSEDLTFREIARRLKEPLNTIKSRHRRALKLIRRHNPEL